MSLNCEIVKDLVALYTDNSANPKTVAEIEEHLSQCEDCANYYKRYQKINEKSPVLSDEPFAAPLSYTKLARRLRIRRIWGRLAFIAAIVAAVVATSCFLRWLWKIGEPDDE